MSLLKNIGRKLDEKFPQLLTGTGKVVAPPEELVKRVLFSCHMCGQCILHSTGLACPMECPKNLRNGPCGGVGMDGSCEVDREKTCTWFKAVNRAEILPWTDEIYQRNPIVDWQLQGSSSWVNTFTGRDHHHRTAPPWQQVKLDEREQRPLRTDSVFERRLRSGEFLVTCEVNPRDTADATDIMEYVATLKGVVDAVHISDNSLASPHMCGLAVAGLIEQIGIETILHMTCRDRNRMMLQADVLGAHALGVRSILCLTGDHPTLGDHPETKPVFDLDSVNFINLTRHLRDTGTFETGRQLAVAPKVLIGGAIGLTAPPLEFRPHRLAKKIAAGADFVTSQLVFDMDLLKLYMQRIRELGLDEKTYILIGIGALASAGMARAIDKYTPGVVVPQEIIKRLDGVPKNKQKDEGIQIVVEQIQELMEIPGIAGIDLMDLQPETWFPTVEIVERAGLLGRPSLQIR